MLRATLLSNAGILFSYRGEQIIIDVLNGAVQSFVPISVSTAQAVINGAAPYQNIRGIFYTHLHPDHYEQRSNAAFLAAHPNVTAFFPVASSPDFMCFQVGGFSLEAHYVEHIACDYPWAKHYVYLLHAGDTSVYLTADAAPETTLHHNALKGRRVDYAFWNSIYLSSAQTRNLLIETANKSFIYHMPTQKDDTSGIWKKAQRNMERNADLTKYVSILDEYPTELSLPTNQ